MAPLELIILMKRFPCHWTPLLCSFPSLASSPPTTSIPQNWRERRERERRGRRRGSADLRRDEGGWGGYGLAAGTGCCSGRERLTNSSKRETVAGMGMGTGGAEGRSGRDRIAVENLRRRRRKGRLSSTLPPLSYCDRGVPWCLSVLWVYTPGGTVLSFHVGEVGPAVLIA